MTQLADVNLTVPYVLDALRRVLTGGDKANGEFALLGLPSSRCAPTSKLRSCSSQKLQHARCPAVLLCLSVTQRSP